MNLTLLTSNFEKAQRELEKIEQMLDEGAATLAQKHALELLKNKFREPNLTAHAKYLLSQALEMQARFADALEAVKIYEVEEVRFGLEINVSLQMETQIARCYSYLNNVSKAAALLKNTAAEAQKHEISDETSGLIFTSLARICRLTGENELSKQYSFQALEKYHQTSDWRGTVNAYLTLGAVCAALGEYENYADCCYQALQILNTRSAPFLRGRTFAQFAAACCLRQKPLESIAALEESIKCFESAEPSSNTLASYVNLGINLVVVGEWERAEECFRIALNAAEAYGDEFSVMAYDAFAELYALRGDYAQAADYQQKALAKAKNAKNDWNLFQTGATWAFLQILCGEYQNALKAAEESLVYAKKIGNPSLIRRAYLLIADACRHLKDTENFKKNLFAAMDAPEGKQPDMNIEGELQYLLGHYVRQKNNDLITAENYFGRAVSIFEIGQNRFRAALSRLELGKVLLKKNQAKALENIRKALQDFRELGAKAHLQIAEDALKSVDTKTLPRRAAPLSTTQILTLRLAEAVTSRELLLRELGAVLHQETKAEKVVVLEPSAEKWQVVDEYGVRSDEMFQIVGRLNCAGSDEERARIAAAHQYSLLTIAPPSAEPACVLVSPPSAAMSENLALRPILRVVELGLDLCALRERDRTFRTNETEKCSPEASLLPGFIHSSPAMRQIVEEIMRISSSNVTVLVTGESGTGKELVSRAIHAHSKRHSRVFVPFNCTTLPRELAEGQLFGYRRGAYTGAVSDSPGVIRSAADGTLFLDEIGDLPLDIQPKLLRFLQEGEVQRLGDQRPTKVDVRVIAATNTDLEKMVAESRFREDLYYRLNVIRLKVPPLRERRSEIPSIVNYYINHYSEKFDKRYISINRAAVDLLMANDWQGNVRQLCNEVQRLVARAEDGKTIGTEDLSPELKRRAPLVGVPSEYGEKEKWSVRGKHSAPSGGEAFMLNEPTRLDVAVADLEKRLIRSALLRHKYNIARTARELGLTRRGLYMKLDRYQIDYKNLETPPLKKKGAHVTRFDTPV